MPHYFAGVSVNVKFSLLFSQVSDMFNAFPTLTVSSLPSLQKWWLKVSLYFSFAFKCITSFNSMCFPGIKEKHMKQQLNLSGIYSNWDLLNNWSSLGISQLRMINFFSSWVNFRKFLVQQQTQQREKFSTHAPSVYKKHHFTNCVITNLAEVVIALFQLQSFF